MKKIALIGFDERIVSSMRSPKYELIDANEIFGDIQSLDKGFIKNRSLHSHINIRNFDIESYWRVKGEFDHYADRRVIPKSFEEQDLLFRYILSLAITLSEQVDYMIFSNLPHQGVDSVINNCAKMKEIPTYFFTPTIFKNYCYLMKQERNFDELIINPKSDETEQFQTFNHSSKQNLYYMQQEFHPKKRKIINQVQTALKLRKLDKILPLRIIYKKFLNYYLHADYRKIEWTLTPKFNDDNLNIYFPLHLQPELTTSNMGGLFYDQNYAILTVIRQCEDKNIKYNIFLKENPKQSMVNRAFLDQFRKNNNVHYVSAEYPSDLLIDNCDVVCTISGTAGWEAIKSGKPCLIFGNTWYETAPGVETDIEKLNITLKTRIVDKIKVKNWFLEHQKCFYLLQNDSCVDEMTSLFTESGYTLKTVIENVL